MTVSAGTPTPLGSAPRSAPGSSSGRPPVVITASRRTDLPRWYPEALVRTLEERYPPDRVHSLVLFTKFPETILAEPLRSALARYDQVLAHVTITGLGGTLVEPRVPPPEEALAALPRLIDFVGSPERVRLRIDPLVELVPLVAGQRDPGAEQGTEPEALLEPVSNIAALAAIAAAGQDLGLTSVTTSPLQLYPKVRRRLAAAGYRAAEPPVYERALDRAADIAGQLGIALHFCAVPGRPRPAEACVDGPALSALHPRGLVARGDKPPGQRELCACTHAVDVGWYASHPCLSGCLYCYANPVIAPTPARGGTP